MYTLGNKKATLPVTTATMRAVVGVKEVIDRRVRLKNILACSTSATSINYEIMCMRMSEIVIVCDESIHNLYEVNSLISK